MFLGEAVHPVIFGNLVAGVVLAGSRLQHLHFGHGRSPLGGVASLVAIDDVSYEVGALQHDATARGLGRCLTEVAQANCRMGQGSTSP
jgi:hypothetical protein